MLNSLARSQQEGTGANHLIDEGRPAFITGKKFNPTDNAQYLRS